MVSAINASLPANGVLASKLDLRTNLLAAKNEIEALQDEVVALLAALQLSSGQTLFPAIPGDNLPDVPANLTTILLGLDAAITAAAAGGGGGAQVLGDLSDILDPTASIRRAFQSPVEIASINASFNFEEATHGGTLIPLNPASQDVAMTLPAAATLSRPDGYLCSVTSVSQANLASIVGPADAIRYQTGLFGLDEIATEVFLGLSQASSFRAVIDIFKVGSIYQVRGQAREDSAADLSKGAAQTVPGTALVNDSLPAAAFPASLDLGGTKIAGGARSIMQAIAGNHTFVQANAGRILVHTGSGGATWTVPVLSSGTTVEVENEGGEITFTIDGGQTTRGGLTLPANTSGAVRWLPTGTVVLLGTTT